MTSIPARRIISQRVDSRWQLRAPYASPGDLSSRLPTNRSPCRQDPLKHGVKRANRVIDGSYGISPRARATCSRSSTARSSASAFVDGSSGARTRDSRCPRPPPRARPGAYWVLRPRARLD